MRHALITCLAVSLLCTLPAWSEDSEDESKSRVTIDSWLMLAPVPARTPSAAEGEVEIGDRLAAMALPSMSRPRAGAQIIDGAGNDRRWRQQQDAQVALTGSGGQQAWLATYIEVDRFIDARIEARSHHPFRLMIDGEELSVKDTAESGGSDAAGVSSDDVVAGQVGADIALAPGKHLLLISALRMPQEHASWTIEAHIEVPAAMASSVDITTSPEHGLRLTDLVDVERLGGIELSPDGDHLAVSYRRPAVSAEHSESWTDILTAADGSLVRSLRGGEQQVHWHPDGRLSYLRDADGDGDSGLWLESAAGGKSHQVLEEVEKVAEYRWLPDGKSLIYVVTVPAEADDRGVKRYRDLPDRWSSRRDRSRLYQASIGGLSRLLRMSGDQETVQDIAPGGDRILIARTHYDVGERPFQRNELFEIDLETLAVEPVIDLGWFTSASYGPEGDRLLVLGGPTLFADGVDLADGERIANDYDGQAFIVDLASKQVEAISRGYTPAVLDARWSKHDEQIYLRVQERSWRDLVVFDPDSGEFTELETPVEVVDGLSLADSASMLAFHGSSPTQPSAAYTRSTALQAASMSVASPGAERFADIPFGKVETWSYEHQTSGEILGRVLYPPDFDPAKRYPLIVDYYGGTVPVSRGFGGRYPKNYWAAQGYVVYTVQPSGATGFGQEFSARHVNDWGKTTADEIIEGTRQFVAAHPFIDGDRIGCIGASYGGFMTMYLQTRTDLFAAAISHAGISNLASYWGEGWWGYLYSAVATAGSYPWNARDLYIEQSPLYNADKITTPILLLHGDADTNVPPGESQQMYTALKVLGKDVELIEIGGEDHWILDYDKRILWMQTIVAYFDMQLKDQPEYWQHLWGTDDEPKG